MDDVGWDVVTCIVQMIVRWPEIAETLTTDYMSLAVGTYAVTGIVSLVGAK
jgi:hypothetical protein